jgi:hypothetical protein
MKTISREADMTQKQDLPEYVRIYRTAQEMLQSAKAWHPDARIMGNVKAGDCVSACEFLIRSIELSYPIIDLCGVEFLFWTCPNNCRGGVLWANRVAVCQTCGESSKLRVSDADSGCSSDFS